jgi:hypothetical protein
MTGNALIVLMPNQGLIFAVDISMGFVKYFLVAQIKIRYNLALTDAKESQQNYR